jgi:UDP-N-acetylmuramyl pentapeptide phosphotransferase/UDP-N-acetylglucosamine-1-phosphate transferase
LLQLFILAFAVSLGIGYLTLRFEHLHQRFSGDNASAGSHKVHRQAVSRIGGLSIFIGWMAALVAGVYSGQLEAGMATIWLLCLLPAFVGGLTEDLTKRVKPMLRVLACVISAALAYWLLGASVSRIDVVGLDVLLGIPVVALVFTCFAVAGVAHAINIIDGLNGLASGVCLIALLALAYVAFQVSDWEILLMSGVGVGAILGFRVWNYPSGRIFCGDGGAYFLGGYVAIISALLVNRHDAVAAWFPLLLVLYPVWETLFSAYRRRVLRGRPASVADKLHLHTLFYKRVKHPIGGGRARSSRNSDASVSMVLFACGSALPAVLWWEDPAFLLTAAVAYVMVYLMIYRRLVRFGAAPMTITKFNDGYGYVARRVAALHRSVSARRTARQANKLH